MAATGTFHGIFTLKTKENADQLTSAVRGIINGSVDIFFVVKSDPFVKKDMEDDLRTMTRLLGEFPDLCVTEDSKAKAIGLVKRLATSAKAIIDVFAQHQSGLFTTEQERVIRTELKNIMIELCVVSDMMEDVQRSKCLRIVGNAFRHLQILKDTSSSYRFNEKCAVMRDDMNNAVRLMRHRSDVLSDADEIHILRFSAQEIETCVPLLIDATSAVIDTPTEAAFATQQDVIRRMARAFADVSRTLQSVVNASGDFDYTSLAEKINALQMSIRAGDTASAVTEAREIANALKKNPNYGDDRLRDLLRQMVELTRQGLDHPEEQSAQLSLGEVLSDMKEEVIQIQLKNVGSKSASADAKASLLSQAKSLTEGLQDLTIACSPRV